MEREMSEGVREGRKGERRVGGMERKSARVGK